ncbi:dihydropteroate synthase [bacterium]|nr:dihydropteroate synthase [bacterium]
MHDFLLKEINGNINSELELIGFDKTYINKAKDKFEYKNFKIYDLTPAQANILKQTALSVGADCATHREVITGKIELSNVILGGSNAQLNKIAKKLEYQPFGLKTLGEKILTKLQNSESKTKIVGILNITQNSFSDGGEYYDFDNAVKHLHKLINDGADIIDIGAESTKPYSQAVNAGEQLKHIIPVLDYIKENNIQIPISIDTRSAEVANECIKYGIQIINDVSGLDYDIHMVEVLAQKSNVKVIIQHSNGTPENMQDNPQYKNLIDDIFFDLTKKVNFAISGGIKKENIIIDPGIGFGKTREQNIEILKRWEEFETIGCPMLIGLSRKSLLGKPQANNDEKDLYTLALNSILISQGIDYIRVHNVKIHKEFINIYS